jgi:hypothetical protein
MSALAIIRVPNVCLRSWNLSDRQSGHGQGNLVPAAQRRSVQVGAGFAGEHQVIIAGPVLAIGEPRQRRRDVLRQRHRTNLARLRGRKRAAGPGRAHTYREAGEVDIAPTQREQLAETQAGERGGQEQSAILIRRGRADQRPHLLGAEHLDVAAYPLRVFLDPG